jgi:hypothetical protein
MLVLPSETGGAQVVVLDAEATLGLGWCGGGSWVLSNVLYASPTSMLALV